MPTALELTPDEWKRYARSGPRARPPISISEEQRSALIAEVSAVARELKVRFGASRVLLFGSLAHGRWFRPDSDLDIAVEGLGGRAYWDAWAYLEDSLQRPVDLVALETAGEAFKRALDRHAVEL